MSSHSLRPVAAVAFLVGASCASTAADTRVADSVQILVRERVARDGMTVQAEGVLRSSHGLLNLYSHDLQVCIGLPMRNFELERFRQLEGQRVSVSGTLHAEGCGRDGICDEHLCGPAILRDVAISRSNSMRSAGSASLARRGQASGHEADREAMQRSRPAVRTIGHDGNPEPDQ